MRVSGLSFVMPLSLSMSCCRSLFRKQPLTGPDISSITMQLYNLETSSKGVKKSTFRFCYLSSNTFSSRVHSWKFSATVCQISVICDLVLPLSLWAQESQGESLISVFSLICLRSSFLYADKIMCT